MRLLRLLVVLGVLGGLTAPASAQSLVRLFSETYADTLSSTGDFFTFNVRGMASARIQTLDTYSGTWEVQCSTDGGVTYDEDDELPLVLLGASSEVSSVTDTVGIWTVNVAGCTHIRVIATAGFAASDTKVRVTAISAGGGAGGSGGGSSFDGVLRDTPGGDPVTDTTNDAIRVNVVAGGSSGNGTSLADDADFTAGTTAFTPVGGFYQSTPTACTDGDACVAGITSARAVKVALENASGTTAFGTAGSPSTAVLSIQGVNSGTAVAVSGTVTANLGATDNGVLDNIDTDLTTIIGHVDGLETAVGLTLTSANFAAAFGTAGTPDSQVLSIQGITNMTPLQVQSNGANLATAANQSTAIGHLSTLAGAVSGGQFQVACVTGCSGGTTDTEDGSIAAGQTTGININLNYAYDASSGQWVRAGQAAGGTGPSNGDTTRTVEASDAPHSVISAASNNATNVKSSAGVLRTIAVVNTTNTVYYMRFYDLATAPTCSSATGFKFTLPIPPDNGGWSVPLNVGFDTGIGYCITGGGSATDDTAAATGIFGVVTYK